MTVYRDAAIRPRHVLVTGMFVVYLALLVWLVLFKLHAPYIGGAEDRTLKLVPFVAADGLGSNAPREVLANLVLFVPFGILMGLVAPSWSWWKTLGSVALFSAALETAQWVFAIGAADLTDVIVNTAGGVLGMLLLGLSRLAFGPRARGAWAVILAIGLVGAVLALALSPLSPAPGGLASLRFAAG
ncbi:MAG: VanZ family protein [Microbacterium sp.]